MQTFGHYFLLPLKTKENIHCCSSSSLSRLVILLSHMETVRGFPSQRNHPPRQFYLIRTSFPGCRECTYNLRVVYLLHAAVVGNVLFTNTWAQKMLNFSSFLNFQMLILLRVEINTKRLFQEPPPFQKLLASS